MGYKAIFVFVFFFFFVNQILTTLLFLVSNKWIHTHGQEFRRSCGLEYDGIPGEKVLYTKDTE